MLRKLTISSGILLLPVLVWAQFYWPQDGMAIRQGAHLGWSGAAVAAGNDVALFYYDCLRDGTRDVWGTRIAANGEHVWGQDGTLVAGSSSEQRAPVAAAYADGSVLVVWEDYSVGRFRDLVAQRYDASGNALWSPQSGVVVVQQERDQFDAKLAINANGFAFIAFTDDRLTVGAETRLNSFAQVLTPDGQRVGPLDGIQLLDRSVEYNQALDVSCVGDDAYVLNSMNSVTNDLVIKKISTDGALGFPNEEAVAEYADFGTHRLIAIENGLALSWAARGGDNYGDARLTLLDTNRQPLPGWSAAGVLVAEGPQVQAIRAMTEAPDGGVVVALADFEFDPDEAGLALYRFSRDGALLWGPIEFGTAALRTTPVDWYWEGDELVIVWTEIENFTHYVTHTQKLANNGQKLWGEAGNVVWEREGKKLRAEVEKPANAAARLVVVSGRSIMQPESLFVGEMNSAGQLAQAEFVSGGLTYDTYDPRSAVMGNDRFVVIWSDSRSDLNRDVYFQILDRSGNALLEPNGRKLTSHTEVSIYDPPAASGDGAGGAFISWIADSVGVANMLNIQHIDASGAFLWDAPATVYTQHGYHGQTYLIPDGAGGVFVVFARFNEAFVARPCVAHINTNGAFTWQPEYHEFPGEAGNDVILSGAASDGNDGVFLSGITGPWTDTQAVLYHIERDGSFGDGWTDAGRTYGPANSRERNSQLLRVENHALLTYEVPHSANSALYHVHGVLVTAEGQDVWGADGRRLSPDGAAVVRHKLSEDGLGGFLLGYEDFRTGDHAHAYVARFDQNGTALWSNVERRAASHNGDQSALALTHDGQGGAWLVWEDLRNSDLYSEIDLYGTHIAGNGEYATIGGFTWPAEGYPICDVPTYQQEPVLMPWVSGSALAVWKDLRSSNPGRCCGAGAVGDIFNNVYGQVLSEVSLGVDDERGAVLPDAIELAAYPNPFNPSSQLAFVLPRNSHVTLTIYNLLGQAVETLLDRPISAGAHALMWDASAQTSGLYFAKLETDAGLSAVTKLVLVK